MNYRLAGPRPAVAVEVYLPKRAAFQGALYATLTEAVRDPAVVRGHFADAARAPEIRAFLRGQADLADFTADEAAALPPLLFGFSSYEVDGVFLSRDGRGVAEERSQVLRLFFQYPLEGAGRGALAWADAFLRCGATTPDEFRRLGGAGAPADLLDAVAAWARQVRLVVHGFLLFRLCDAVAQADRQQKELGRRDTPPLRQEEIWVATAWAVQADRAVEAAD